MLIDESYNANPASMAATLKALGEERDVGRRIAVLGPMRELGGHADELHAGLAPGGARSEGRSPDPGRARKCGRSRHALDSEVAQSIGLTDVEEATQMLARLVRPGDAVLVKASNSIGLAKLVERMAGGLQMAHADKDTLMLYWIAEQLGFPGLLNLIRYISFRAGAATATALTIGLLLGPVFIRWLRAKQGKGQPIRADGPQSHLAKRGTPTMGGLLILISVAISVLLWMDLTNVYVWACLLVTGGFGLIGFLDDYDKVKKAHHAGPEGPDPAVAGIHHRRSRHLADGSQWRGRSSTCRSSRAR